jgi:hypothetical protein
LDNEGERRQMLKNLKLACIQLINLARKRKLMKLNYPKYPDVYTYTATNNAEIVFYFYKKTTHIHLDYPRGLVFIFNLKGEQVNIGQRQRLREAFTSQTTLTYYYYAVKEAIVKIV